MNRIESTSWHELPAWALDSDAARVVMVPVMGAKIVSLRDKRGGLEWIVGPVPGRPVKPATYAAPFTKQDMAGWDEMFPTIIACPYPGPGPLSGAPLPDHGEAWSLPWAVAKTANGELALTLRGRALPYRLTRAASFVAPDVLTLRYTLENLGDAPMPYIWAAHPQFLAGRDCQIILPPEVTEVINTIPAAWGWGPPGTRLGWPEATAIGGRRVRLDEVGPPSLGKARKFFATLEVRPSWAAVVRRESGHWLRLEWNPDEVPYLGLWVDEGAVNCEAVVVPEPTTGWYDDLALACRKQQVKVVPGGGFHEWTLTVRLGANGNPRPVNKGEAKT